MKKKISEIGNSNRILFNNLAPYYDKSFVIRFLFLRLQRKILEIISVKTNSRILDVGCGTGNFLSLLLQQNKKLGLYGVDISKEMLKIAKNKLKKKAVLSENSAEKMKFKKNYIDYVFSTEAFHHFENHSKVIKNSYNILKSGGKLVISDLDFSYFFNWFFHLLEPGNTKVFTKKEIKNLFIKNKFKNIKQKRLMMFFVVTVGEK